jgi:hypothetical protein
MAEQARGTIPLNKKTGLGDQRMTTKPGEFSNLAQQ